MKRINPVLAMVFAIGAFIATSMIFNVVFWAAVFLHVDRFLGGFLQGIASFAILLLVFPFSIQASRSRVSPRFVGFVASILLSGIYFFAVRNEVVLLTHYLFPHVPGKDFRVETATAPVGLIIFIAIFVVLGTYLSKPGLGSDEATRKSSTDRTDEATEAATEVGEGIVEGISEQITHHH
jgi:hypothetical protein